MSVREPGNYSGIGKKSWDWILRHNQREYHPVLSTHTPIHPVFARDFVHVECGLNAVRRRVYPGLSVRKKGDLEFLANTETMFVEFAFNNPPFIPASGLSRLSLYQDQYPIMTGQYYALDLNYQLEYLCPQVDEFHSILGIRISVHNEAAVPQVAHVWAKVNLQLEKKVFDYHYKPYYWDNTRWPDCRYRMGLKGNRILKSAEPIGRVIPGGFTCRWERKRTFSDGEFTFEGCERPYLPKPNYRLKKVTDVLHATAPLKPGRQKSFILALQVNHEDISGKCKKALCSFSFPRARKTVLKRYQGIFKGHNTRLECKNDKWENIFKGLQINILQLLVKFKDDPSLMPTQGGSSERAFVWVWEALFMLRTMLRLGHFTPVKKALDFIFRLQDCGYPPEGKLASIKGAIGTTGPSWLNSTGSALVLAAEYHLYSKDEEFLKQYLPKILRAADWIINELQHTRQRDRAGRKIPYYGLMPDGQATDISMHRVITFTDAYTFLGLERTVAMLTMLRYPRVSLYSRELNQYQRDLTTAIKNLAPSDSSYKKAGDLLPLVYTGVLDVNSALIKKHIARAEKEKEAGYFLGRMNSDIQYLGIGEHCWHDVYLRRGNWKKAFVAMQTKLKYAMTPDTFQVAERFSKSDPSFVPWQPNGSGNGRVLDMMIKSFYFEHEHSRYGPLAVILGGMPFAWLKDNGRSALKGLYTPRGKVNVQAVMRKDHTCLVTVSADRDGGIPATVRIPRHFKVIGLKQIKNEFYTFPAGRRKLTFTVINAETA